MTNFTIFVGNPGTGKSSLLNALIRKALFRSGVSYGKGLTSVLQLQQAANGDFYGDTPGLSDVKMREKAAAEISKALRSGEGNYKLVFVVTQESGRVRPADCVTMKLVLDALPKDRNVPYGIIVNKISKTLKEDLETNQENYQMFAACLNEGREHPTAYIHLYEEIAELKDANNKVHEPTHAFKQFLYMLPSVHIKPEEVLDVRASEFDAQVEALETQLEELINDKKRLETKIEKDRKEVEKQVKEIQNAQKEALDTARAEYDEKMRQMEESYAKKMTQMQEEQKKATGKELQELSKKMSEMDKSFRKSMSEAQEREKELLRSMNSQQSKDSLTGLAEVIGAIVPFAMLLL